VSASSPRARAIATLALFAGAAAIATAPLFVRWSETGPIATAFWRIALALPLLWGWSVLEQRGRHLASFAANRRLLVLAGLFFAADLAVWHWSIVLTSVANATLLSNLAPIFVTLAAWVLFGRRPIGLFLVGLATALGGVTLLIGAVAGLVVLVTARELVPAAQRLHASLLLARAGGAWRPVQPPSGSVAGRRFPYGLAIAGGAMAALWWMGRLQPLLAGGSA